MGTGIGMRRMDAASARLLARAAGALYFVSVAIAVGNEFIAKGKFGLAGIVVPIACQAAVALLLYAIFRPVSRSAALSAVCFQFVALSLEAFEWQLVGVNVAMVFHGFFALLLGYLIARSNFLPRILGAPMAFAGLCWLAYLWPRLATNLVRYQTVCGLLGEALPMLWLLVMGVDVGR